MHNFILCLLLLHIFYLCLILNEWRNGIWEYVAVVISGLWVRHSFSMSDICALASSSVRKTRQKQHTTTAIHAETESARTQEFYRDVVQVLLEKPQKRVWQPVSRVGFLIGHVQRRIYHFRPSKRTCYASSGHRAPAECVARDTVPVNVDVFSAIFTGFTNGSF